MAKWFLAEYYLHKLFTYEDRADKVVLIADDAEDTVPQPEYTSIPLSVKEAWLMPSIKTAEYLLALINPC